MIAPSAADPGEPGPHRRRLRLDAYQRRHRTLGIPIAVVYKFTDDQGAYLASLLTYYGFVSVFPILLLGVTVLGFFLGHHGHLQGEIVDSALSEFPVIGPQLADVHGYHGSTAGIVIGIVGSLYGGLGVAQAGQNAMNVVWAVPRNQRPNPIKARMRSLVVLGIIGVFTIVTTGLAGLATGAGAFNSHLSGISVGLRALDIAASLVIDVGIFVLAFRVLTAKQVGMRDVLLGGVFAGIGWQLLQDVGTYYIGHELKGSSSVYGLFAIVLGLIAWIHVESIVVVLCAELNVVIRRRLWPRALLTPFTDAVELTAADERAYASYARAQRFKGFEAIEVRFLPRARRRRREDERSEAQ